MLLLSVFLQHQAMPYLGPVSDLHNREGINPYIILGAVLFILIVAALAPSGTFVVNSHWQHLFNNYQFSSKEFYEQVEAKLRDEGIPGVSYGRESFAQTNFFSARREYLKVSRNEFIYYICAAPFGKGSFVSWYMCEKGGSLLSIIPVLNWLTGQKKPKKKTFFQMDTENMYRSAVHSAVLFVVDKISNPSGERGLSELERQYIRA